MPQGQSHTLASLGEGLLNGEHMMEIVGASWVWGSTGTWVLVTLALWGMARRQGLAVGGIVALCAGLFLLDPLVLGLGLLAALACAAIALWALLRLGRAARVGERSEVARNAYRLGVLATTALLAGATAFANFELADHRARRVVAAIERFEQEHGHLPRSLEALVPAQLAAVPSPRVLLVPDTFHYRARGEAPQFGYTLGPMFGRVYDFGARRWRPLDSDPDTVNTGE